LDYPIATVYGSSAIAKPLTKDEEDNYNIAINPESLTKTVEDAIASAMAANPALTEEDVQALVIDLVNERDVPQESDSEKEETGEIVGGVDIPASSTDAINSSTSLGLQNVFPFCIPFDLVDFIGCLAADPEAPYIKYPVKYPTADGWGVYELEIDLSRFDSVAKIVRTMELLAFCIGLAKITRDMIRG
jgi:hypothetical protein